MTNRDLHPIQFPVPSLPPSGIDPIAQLEDEHYRRGRPVTSTSDETPDTDDTEHDP
jgi:hypothetical protein